MQGSPKPVYLAYDGPKDAFDSQCWVCGVSGSFERDRMSITESYRCSSCRSPLRYQGQARAILWSFARHGARSIAELITEPGFRRVKVFEPGAQGPLRRYLRKLDEYFVSVYEPSAVLGEVRDGVRYEDLMNLSFERESMDLVITSDIFEHVRHPDRAFAEVYRVLRPGGTHIFTIPGRWPMSERTVSRVDVSSADDIFLLPPVYHNSQHLVYNDFGYDLLDRLDELGFVTNPMLFASLSATTSSQVTFCCVRPVPRP